MTSLGQKIPTVSVNYNSRPWACLGGSVSRIAFWVLGLSPVFLTILGIVIPNLSTHLTSSYYSFFEIIFIFGVYAQHGRNNSMISGLPLYVIIAAVSLGLWSIITSVVGPHDFISLHKTAQWTILIVFFLALTTKGRLENNWFTDATQILAIGFVVYIFYMLAWFTVIPDLETYNWRNKIPGLWNIRQFAYYIACMYALSLCMLLNHDSETGHINRVICLLLMCLSASLLLWSGSRGSSISIAIAIAVLLYHVNSKRIYFSAFIFFSIVFAVLISQAFPSHNPSLGFNRVLTLGLSNLSDSYDFLSGRGPLWSETWSAISLNPWSGYGPGIMPFLLSNEIPNQNHPHNIFLQFWINWGIPGLTIAILSFIILVKSIVIRQSNSPYPFKPAYVGGITGASYLVADSMINGTLFYSQPLMFGAFFISLMLSKTNYSTFPKIPSRSLLSSLARSAAHAIFSTAVAYFLLVNIAIASFYSDQPEKAVDIRAKIARAFPVQAVLVNADLRYVSWLTDWYKGTNKVPAEEWKWLENHCLGQHCSLLYQAMILQNEGHKESAHVLFEKVSRSNSPAHNAYAQLQLGLLNKDFSLAKLSAESAPAHHSSQTEN